MSAVVISSLVRCGERDRKHKKEGRDTMKVDEEKTLIPRSPDAEK